MSLVTSNQMGSSKGLGSSLKLYRNLIQPIDYVGGIGGGDLIFGRPSVSTYVNSSGLIATAANNIPRYEYTSTSPYTLRGLLMEMARTNYLAYSSTFTNGAWTKSNLTVANTGLITAPDGNPSACTITDNTNNVAHYISATGTNTGIASTSYTFSVFVKPISTATKRYIQISLGPTAQFSSTTYANFDLVSGTGTATTGVGVVSAVSTYYEAQGYYRISIQATMGTTIANPTATIAVVPATSSTLNAAYAGAGVAQFYIWGAQLERSTAPVGANSVSIPTSYIPTDAGSNVARQNDTLILPDNTYTTVSAAASIGATSISVNSTAGIYVGTQILATGLAENTTVSAINGLVLTISPAATGAVALNASVRIGISGTGQTFLNPRQGTLIVELEQHGVNATAGGEQTEMFYFDYNGTGTNYIALESNGAGSSQGFRLYSSNNSAAQVNITTNTGLNNTTYRLAGSYNFDANSYSFYLNGSLIGTTTTSKTAPNGTLDKIYIGSSPSNYSANGHIKLFAYYNYAIPNSVLPTYSNVGQALV